MEPSVKKPVITTIIAIIITLSVSFVKAEVYKVVDEHGNVTYTDQQPTAEANPVDLPPISVIQAPEYQLQTKERDSDTGVDAGAGMTIGDMRKNYADFALISPRAKEQIWRPDIVITAVWKTRMQIQQGMMVDIYVDDKLYQTTSNQAVPLGALDRGEHQVSAKLVDSKKQNVATAEPITFFVRQPMNYPVRPKPASDGD